MNPISLNSLIKPSMVLSLTGILGLWLTDENIEIEMFLKLALYKTGHNDRDLKTFSLRHNLLALKAKCESVGVTFSEDVAKMIEVLSPLHENHKLKQT